MEVETIQPLQTVFAECVFVPSWLPVHFHVWIQVRKWCRWMLLLFHGWRQYLEWIFSVYKEQQLPPPFSCPPESNPAPHVTLGQLKAIGIERCLCVHVWAHVCFLVISSDEPQEALQVSQCFTPSSPSLSHVHHFCSSFISPSSQSVCRDSHARWLWFRLPSAFSASHFPDLL